MIELGGARLVGTRPGRAEVALDRGFALIVDFLGDHLARLLVVRPGGLRLARTWSISPELGGGEEARGRLRLDRQGFADIAFEVEETERAIVLQSRCIRVEIARAPLALTWQHCASAADEFTTVLADRPTSAYQFERTGAGFSHFLIRDPAERYYGFGEKSGDADKHGRRLVMATTDALGYDSETSDPLYKHIPYYVTVRPDRAGAATGLFYDNLARGTLDLGQTIDAYHGLFRSFAACDGDLDVYVLFGPALADVVAGFANLTGRSVFPPRWSLSYSGSTMQYTDAPDAADQLAGFLDKIAAHQIACQSFHMSSGYTLIGERRFVFTWNRDRFPDPRAVTRRFADAGVHLIANIKPAMLIDHPRFAEVEAFRGFVRDSEDESRPHITQFWGGPAAYFDFTNPATRAWWTGEVGTQLIANGIDSTWNDNNEFEIWDDAARVALDGDGGTMACLRPVQTLLMTQASKAAQTKAAPTLRPHLVSRSGGPGMQRHAQTWSGDNKTEWKTLRYNLRMGHGMSLSALFSFGHDVGGFAGRRPEPELLMRWIEQGIYWPRFTIHSWNDDASVTEPWTYPELLEKIRDAVAWRERLVPLLYTLAWRAHDRHEPIVRPLFYDFPQDAECYEEDDTFMLGPDLLVAPVVEQGTTERALWLPDVPGGWYDVRSGRAVAGGRRATVAAPLGAAPVFARAGSILPLGPAPSTAAGPLTLRLFPDAEGRASAQVFDDDGVSVFERLRPPCLLDVAATSTTSAPAISIRQSGPAGHRWTGFAVEDMHGFPLAATPVFSVVA